MALLGRRLIPPLPANPSIPEGNRVYVFGDVHGRADLFARLEGMIRADLKQSPASHVTIIGLGDYIDRGPDSRAVVDRAIALGREFDAVFIRGNHEAIFEGFLANPAIEGENWVSQGGFECLLSFGVQVRWNARTDELVRARNDLAARLSPDHLLFLQSLRLSHQIGDYFFAHAGARPGTPLDRQEARDLLWIRRGFSDRDEPFEKIVVHGHTPVQHPYLGRYRINLDTGAYATGRLTCMVLEAERRRFMEATS
jgi:serine/threonine protein phosphatase 1